jgi:hypothetical protein
MPNTFVKIASYAWTTNVNSITFSSIPGTYTDLLLNISPVQTGANDTLRVRLNNDSSNLYSNTRLTGSGTAASSDRFTVNGFYGDYLTSSTGPIPASSQHYFANYTGSNFKSINIDHAWEANTTAAFDQLMAALYRSTSAINRIDIFTGGSNFAEGTTATLYGIKNTA